MNVSAFATFEGEFRERAKAGEDVEFEIRFAVDQPGDVTPSVAILKYSFNGADGVEVPLLNEPHQFK